jgi:hypothetical protein
MGFQTCQGKIARLYTGLENLKYSIDYLGWAFANTPQVAEDDQHWNVEMIWTLGRCNT